MADLKPIEFPEELRHHNLSEQELAPLNDQQRALAKDWNVIKRQNEWLIYRVVDIHNVIVEHDRALDTWKFWLKVFTIASSGSGALGAVLYFFSKHV